MAKKYQAMLIAFILATIGIVLVYYKVSVVGLPFLPDQTRSVYTIDAEIKFEGAGKPVLVSMALPPKQSDMQIISEDASSAGYGFTKASVKNGERAEWAKRRVNGRQTLYYSIQVVKESSNQQVPVEKVLPSKEKELLLDIPVSLQSATKNLLKDIRWRSADPHSFTAQLIRDFSQENPSQAVKILLAKSKISKQDMLYKLLRYEKLAVQKVNGLYLNDSKRNIQLTPLIRVYNGKKWQLFDLEKGKIEKNTDFFIWRIGGSSILDVTGAKKSKVLFSVAEHFVPTKQLVQNEKILSNNVLLDFSLFSLPSSKQNAFKGMLLVPLGALVVVFLRVFVGLRTSGTFMPILIAMAFMQTTLAMGLIMFIVIVSIGLIIRSYLSNLNLLLVARISAVVIVVILIMSSISILSFKMGLQDVLNITFFPMIILAWTIERMSILWEEEGPKEVVIQGGGSLLVATFAYFVMSNEFIGQIIFNFPEILLVVLAIIILMGRYSGYRLSELIRFKSFVD